MRFAVLLLSAAALTRGLTAQPAAAPDASAPDAARLPLRTDTLTMLLVRGGDTIPIGRAIDVLEERVIDGERVLFRVYRSESALSGTLLDTTVNAFPSLAPRRHATRSSWAVELVRFTENRAIGVIHQPTGDSIIVDVAMPTPVYGSASFDLVLRASPLAEGWSATVPAFLNSTRVVAGMNARVGGVDRIDGEPCWRVDAEFQGMPVTFWVSQRDRGLCRQELRPRAGVSLLFVRYRAPGERVGVD